MIPTYNCGPLLAETLASVLAQDPGPELMQIEVVDDRSTRDAPEGLVRALGGGRVSFFRQPVNGGHVCNFNTCLLRARGQLVHILHGDDQVRAGFYQRISQVFAEYPEVGAAFCRSILTDHAGLWRTITPLQQSQSGLLEDWVRQVAVDQQIRTPAVVVRRALYERLGGYDTRIRAMGEDWEMWVRIAARYPVWYEAEPLAIYRMHDQSLTGRFGGTGTLLADQRVALAAVEGELRAALPSNRLAAALNDLRSGAALFALADVHAALVTNKPRIALRNLATALRLSRSPRVVYHALTLALSFVGRRTLSAARAALQPAIASMGMR